MSGAFAFPHRNDLSPATAFPSPQYATFADYYACKYGLHLSGAPTDQPLLDAAYAPLRLAPLLVPRGCVTQRKSNNDGTPGNANSSSKHTLPRHIQLLVPEFCHRHAMPATGEDVSDFLLKFKHVVPVLLDLKFIIFWDFRMCSRFIEFLSTVFQLRLSLSAAESAT